MERDEIAKLTKSYLDQSIAGLEIENPKIDFKSCWYNLSNARDISEFLKDTSAIANTFGLDGFIIIGFDEKNKTFHKTTFKDSNIRDTSLITDLINKNIDRLFEINIYDVTVDGKDISVIHIPPSIDKPHVIRSYKKYDKQGNVKEELQRIFVRKGTSTYPAGKNDIELMFYDRKNIIPEYKVLSSFHVNYLYLSIPSSNDYNKRVFEHIKASIPLTFENIGRRPVAINEINARLSIYSDPSPHEVLNIRSIRKYKAENIVVHPNEIRTQMIDFISRDYNNFSYEDATRYLEDILNNKKNLTTKYLSLILSTGETLNSELSIAMN